MGPVLGVPSVSSRPGSLGQILLRSWPWEGHRRSEKDDVQSVSDFPAGQTPHAGAVLEELVRFVMGLVSERGDIAGQVTGSLCLSE